MIDTKFFKYEFKRKLNAARRFLISRFFYFSKEDLSDLLYKLGIRQGDVVMAHTSFDRFQGFTGDISDIIRVLQTAVGESGALLMPTLPFSGAASDYLEKNEVMDVAKTPSQMGFLTEIFRRLPGVERSVHPTHPVAAWGAQSDALIRDHHLSMTPCGEKTPFHRLLEMNGKILLIGTSIRSMTYFHAVEEILEPAMPFSPFTNNWYEGRVRDRQGNLVDVRMRLFDPDLSKRRDTHIMVPTLKKKEYWRQGRIGFLVIVVLEAKDVLEVCQDLSGQGVYCYH